MVTGRPERRRPSGPTIAFASLVFFILAVSVHDAVLALLYENVLAEEERNPVGKWLIARGGGSAWLLVSVKLVSTSFVGTVLLGLFQTRRQAAMAIAAGIAFFQLGLLAYLSLV